MFIANEKNVIFHINIFLLWLYTSFQTRKIIGAIHQQITFNEYLPIVLGEYTMNKYNLWTKKKGFADMYNPVINPSISNVFATAAFRYLPGRSQRFYHVEASKNHLANFKRVALLSR